MNIKKHWKKINLYPLYLILSLLICGCSTTETPTTNTASSESTAAAAMMSVSPLLSPSTDESTECDLGYIITDETLTFHNTDYTILTVDGGDRSGTREDNVAVNIGFGDRQYWGLTNEYGQLVYVLADIITLQDETTEPVTSKGRYYSDEADVPGTEHPDLDQGHIIADSLGGVANAYNITPQNSVLNRHGNQAYMEKNIRDAGGCINFIATITYENHTTQTPSHYEYQYTLKGNEILDSFDNIDPEIYNDTLTSLNADTSSADNNSTSPQDLSSVDTNRNGTVTIQEAKDAGYVMPITSDHWLYPYMIDGDGDGMVGE